MDVRFNQISFLLFFLAVWHYLLTIQSFEDFGLGEGTLCIDGKVLDQETDHF